MTAENETAAPTLSVCIPFPGFYESLLSGEIDSTEEYLAECVAEEPERDQLPAGVTRDMIARHLWECVDYSKVHDTLARAWADTFAVFVNDNARPEGLAPFVFEFEKMASPREYNFTTDRIFCRVPLAQIEAMRAAVSPGTFAAVLREMFTSRDGFISFYSNDPDRWNAKPLGEWDHNETGALLVAYVRDHYAEYGHGGSLEYRVFMEMIDAGDSPFYSAVSDALDYDKLRERLAGALAA